jgi:tetratricopeptide (TPR) repeat protein
MSKQLRSACLLTLFTLTIAAARTTAQTKDLSPDAIRQIEHQDPTWLTVAPHLPDPATASPEKLETAGDVLRARRFPVDAIDYYTYALKRGGKEAVLLNKIGVTELELRHVVQARADFQRVVQLKRKSAEGWNNLGAVDYLDRRYNSAVSDYNHAIKLNRKSATFHSNLGMAYFDEKDFESARKQFNIALTIDPAMLEHQSSTGISAHLLSPDDHARFCYEMARLYAQRQDELNMLHFLTMASEGGYDVAGSLGSDQVLSAYRKDPQVVLLLHNAHALRANHISAAQIPAGVPPLPAETHE